MAKGKDQRPITDLLRSNAALALLCFISIALLFILIERREQAPAVPAKALVAVPPAADAGQGPDNLPYSPFRDMPDPSAYASFVYETGKTVTATGTCEDAYRVILIYPAATDYRSDPAAALYNQAAPCNQGKPYSVDISPDPSRFSPGESYYVITASEGATGLWHDPQ